MRRDGGRELAVHVPMVPASCLLPNAQRRLSHHAWGPDAKALRLATKHAAWNFDAAVRWASDAGPLFSGPVRIAAVIAWPVGRKRCDFQAAIHALKAAVDGLEDAGVVSDDRLVVGMDVEQIRAAPSDRAGWVRLTIREVTDGG